MYVKEAWADNGPVIKRVMPMAMGSRGIIKRKTCHVTIRLTDQQPKKK
jgi:large subunit ribosomal protein L22